MILFLVAGDLLLFWCDDPFPKLSTMIIPCDFSSLFPSEEALKPDVLIKTIRFLRFQIDFLFVRFSPIPSSATNFVFDWQVNLMEVRTLSPADRLWLYSAHVWPLFGGGFQARILIHLRFLQSSDFIFFVLTLCCSFSFRLLIWVPILTGRDDPFPRWSTMIMLCAIVTPPLRRIPSQKSDPFVKFYFLFGLLSILQSRINGTCD
jgi:hypothetical protein